MGPLLIRHLAFLPFPSSPYRDVYPREPCLELGGNSILWNLSSHGTDILRWVIVGIPSGGKEEATLEQGPSIAPWSRCEMWLRFIVEVMPQRYEPLVWDVLPALSLVASCSITSWTLIKDSFTCGFWEPEVFLPGLTLTLTLLPCLSHSICWLKNQKHSSGALGLEQC